MHALYQALLGGRRKGEGVLCEVAEKPFEEDYTCGNIKMM